MEDRWFLTHFLEVPDGLEVLIQISGLKDVRKPIKKAPIHHLLVGSLEVLAVLYSHS